MSKCSEPGSVCTNGFSNIWVLENYYWGIQQMMVPRCSWRIDSCAVPRRAKSRYWCLHVESKEEHWVNYLNNYSLNEPIFSLSKYFRRIWGQGLNMRCLGSCPFPPLCLGFSHTLDINGSQQGWFLPPRGTFGRVWRHFWLSQLETTSATGIQQIEAMKADNQPTYDAQDSLPQ